MEFMLVCIHVLLFSVQQKKGNMKKIYRLYLSLNPVYRPSQGSNFIVAIAVEGEQNAVDDCGNNGNFLLYSAIFILFTVHYYFDT